MTPTSSTPPDLRHDRLAEAIDVVVPRIRSLMDAVSRIVVGQEDMVRSLVIGMVTGGHVLLEGLPGLAKTLAVSTFARGLDATFSRIQFTPDLLPADLIGTLIYNPREGVFLPRRGPVFANIVLADEINRAPAKVQSALLEAMQERQVTLGDETHALPSPFLVLATQNPIEQEGTYALPEAQVDRFLLKVRVGYPTREQERAIVDRMASTTPPPPIGPVLRIDEVAELRSAVDAVRLDERIRDYIVDLVHATRDPAPHVGERRGAELSRLIEVGASPRASIGLALAGRATAFLNGRTTVIPSDVKSVAMDILRHRVIVSYEAEAEGIGPEAVIREVLDAVPVP